MQATRTRRAPTPSEKGSPRHRSVPRLMLAGAAAVAALAGVLGVHAITTPDARPATSRVSGAVVTETTAIAPGREAAEDPGDLSSPATSAPAVTADFAAFAGPGGD